MPGHVCPAEFLLTDRIRFWRPSCTTSEPINIRIGVPCRAGVATRNYLQPRTLQNCTNRRLGPRFLPTCSQTCRYLQVGLSFRPQIRLRLNSKPFLFQFRPRKLAHVLYGPLQTINRTLLSLSSLLCLIFRHYICGGHFRPP